MKGNCAVLCIHVRDPRKMLLLQNWAKDELLSTPHCNGVFYFHPLTAERAAAAKLNRFV